MDDPGKSGGAGSGDGMALAAVLSLVSLLSIGGGPKLMAPLSHQLVTVHGWITGAALMQIYGISRFLPGTGGLILLTGLVGWSVAGAGGGLTMPFAVLVPPLAVAVLLLPWWQTRIAAPWKADLVRAVGPVSVGQGIAGGLAILHFAGLGRTGLALAAVAGMARFAGMPVPVVLAAGAVCGLCLSYWA